MPMFTGYIISQGLYASPNAIVYRARRQADGAAVILKTLPETYPTSERLAWLVHEYELICDLANVPGVVQAIGLEQYANSWMMVLADRGGDSLADLNLAGNLDLSAFLHLALALTRTLGHIHQQRVIHKDLNPSNIVYHPETHEITLIDFGLATRLPRETTTFGNATTLEGTLPYLAPEQTGRMNRAVDYRSDFYSLGITLYEILTGQVPFTSDDPLELIHSHIAHPPQPPHTVRSDIPIALSYIILKVLAKDADARYQSAYGLQMDLEQCLQRLETTGTIAPFPIAQQDVSDHFALPQKFYGREREIGILLGTFDQVAAGKSALLLVAGAPGIGKTALVQELYRPLTKRRGFFISGKFDQVQRNIPYLAFAQAFRALVRHLLTEPEAVLQQWRERITATLGVNGHVVIEVIPDLALVIGPQPPGPELGPQEAQNRFLLVFQQFLSVFTHADHPLVLFLDDLQWADSGSLKLLEQLLSSLADNHLLVIGAYRDTEMPPNHPLWSTLAMLQQDGIAPQTLTLGPLHEGAVTTLVQDALHVDAATAQPLAVLLLQKTWGNPFFLGEFLKALYIEELLTFDPTQGCWTWQLDQIEARQMTDNVVELMTEQLQRLPDLTQQTLQRAACIGSRFDLSTLATVSAQQSAETATHLEPALLAGLLESLGERYPVMPLDAAGLAETVQIEYYFAHDRVQQAAYEQVPESERIGHHWRIGRLLLATIPAEQREERLFDLVGQLNAGRALANAAERLELAGLNLEAGHKARASAAFAAADAYFHVGLELLPMDAWDAHYPLVLALHSQATETAYLNGDFATMEQLAEVVLVQARTPLDRVKVYEVRVQAALSQGRLSAALQTGVVALQHIGVILPAALEPAEAAQATQALHRLLAQHAPEDLLELPAMTDPTQLATIQLLMRLFSPAYVAAPTLLPFIVLEAVERSIQHGNAPGSTFAYSTAGILCCGVVGDFETGYGCGLLAVRLVERFQAYAFQGQVNAVFHCHIRNWREPLRPSIPQLLATYQVALETGNLFFSGVNALLGHLLAYYSGWQLDDLEQSAARHHQALLQVKDTYNGTQLAQLRQAIRDLQMETLQPGRLRGTLFDEEVMLPHYQAVSDGASIAFLSVHKLILAYLFGETALLPACIALAEEHVAYLTANPSLVPINMYSSLARLWLSADAPAAEQPAVLERVATNQQQLQTWAQHAPMNYQHKWHLVEAERCRVLGQMGAAREHYDQAIAGAREHQFIQEEALAYELAGHFYRSRGQTRLASVYLQDAYHAYSQWGATAKLPHLAQYDSGGAAPLDAPLLSAVPTLAPAQDQKRRPISTSKAIEAGILDTASIFKAAQAISGEMQLDALLTRLLHVLLENAGADRGVLLLQRAEQWVVEADGRIGEAMAVIAGTPLEQADVPQSLLSYVLRTGESIVLHNAPAEGSFTQDAYIQQEHPRSILAQGLHHQGALTGLLYLENRQATGVFTPERQHTLALLSGQVAISLENARLYADLQGLVAERTAQLAVAEEARALKDRFVSNMSHELRTPLNSIANFAYILQAGLRGPLTEGQLAYLARIHASGERLLNLINGIFDLAQMEAHQLVLYKTEEPLEELIGGALETVRGLVAEKGLRLEHEPAAALPVLRIDRVRIRQVLLHLLNNAIKFTEEGQITVRAHQTEDTVTVSVSDTGVGIPADAFEFIFEPFRQVDDQSDRAFEGAGLGLTLCQQLIALHGGRLWVESAVGVGSTFSFSLPLTAAVAPTAPESPSDPTGPGPVVLVVDQDPAMVEIVGAYLGQDGYVVHGVADSRQALAMVRHLQPVVILLDVIMPYKDGWEVLTDLKASSSLQAIPVVVCTILDAQRLATALGAAAYLLKPIDEATLRRTIQALRVGPT